MDVTKQSKPGNSVPTGSAVHLSSSLLAEEPVPEPPNSQDIDGAFEGSFAGTARDATLLHVQPWYRRREYYLEGWTDPVIWRSAVTTPELPPNCLAFVPLLTEFPRQVVECVAMACSVYLSGQFGMTLMNSGVTQLAAYVGIFNAIFLALFIYATATATGGHLNPMITFATVLCGLTPVSRGETGRW